MCSRLVLVAQMITVSRTPFGPKQPLLLFYMSSLWQRNLRLLVCGIPFSPGSAAALPLPACLGGSENVIGTERGCSDVEERFGTSGSNEQDDLFDLSEMIGASKSLEKKPLFETKQSEVNLSTAEERIFEEGNTQGASKSRASVDNKKFR